MCIWIQNVQCVTDGGVVRCDLHLARGIIQSMTAPNSQDIPADAVHVDGTKLTAFPGLFDMHVHLRDPGQTHKEDIFSGTAAALAGGITGLACMPNTTPPVDNVETVAYILKKAADTGVSVHPVGCITEGMKGETLSDFASLQKAGICAVSDDGRPVENAEMMRQALLKAYALQLPVISHCEDLSIVDGGLVDAGAASEMLSVKGMDRSSEDTITAREVILAAATDTRVHIAHVSTKGSVEIVRHAKSLGVKVTSETCPHYFLMTEERVFCRDADYRMNPPLRTEEDRRAVLAGILDGTIDCIVTDHAPHAPAEKADFLKAPNGVIGMETSFSATLQLYHAGLLSLPGVVRLMAINPRRVLGLPQVRIAPGEPARLFLADLNYSWMVDPKKLHSKAHNAIWKGCTLKGKPVLTVVGDGIRYRDEEYFG